MKGKGAAGQLVQVWFALDPNDGRAEADLVNVRFTDGKVGDVEIKLVPLMLKKNGYRIKERCKVTSIEYASLLGETWVKSRARKKLLSVLFIFYEYAGAESWTKSRVKKVLVWEVEKEQLKDLIRSDWERTYDFVEKGRAHEISEGHNAVLGASTSGAGGEATYVTQPRNADQPARKRAFSLKPAFLQTTYDWDASRDDFASIKTLSDKVLGADLQKAILDGFEPYVGKTLGWIADELKIRKEVSAKQGPAILVRRVLGITNTKKRLLELEALGVSPKIIPVRRHDLRPCEAMSFPVAKLKEVAEEEWEHSEFRANLDCLLMIPTLTEHCKKGDKWARILGRPFFWTPSDEEETGIEKEWEMYRKEILTGKAAYRIVDGLRKSNLTSSKQTEFIHMRPKGPDASVDDEDPLGNKTVQLCFWLNQAFVQKLLTDQHLRRRLV